MMTSQETSIANPSVAGQSSVADVMYVDVKGAVKQPGIKKVDQTMRVIDAVHLAGGFTSLADEKQINLAQRLTDSQVIYIPKRGEKKCPQLLPTKVLQPMVLTHNKVSR